MSDQDNGQEISEKAAELYVDTKAERELSLREQVSRMMATFGSTDSLLVGTMLNVATVMVGGAIYIATYGLLSYAGAVLAILGVLGLLSGVLRL